VTVDDRSGSGAPVNGSVKALSPHSGDRSSPDEARRAAVLLEQDRAWFEHRSGKPAAFANHPNSKPSSSPAYGALDLGTNNCRLLIARPAPNGFRVIDAFSRIVRLGEGLGTTGMLGQAAMDRAVDALKVCALKLDLRQVRRARLVTTEACRAASNGAAFIARVSD
jgi:exopolyphosphatase / guanosine-5'-triphosphate,3'-diphosphate pyrophosphatase